MRLNAERVREYLRDCDFNSLFVEELGWSHCGISPFAIPIDGHDYTLTAVSEMGGMVVLRCGSASYGRLPDYHVRRKIDRMVSKLHYEHIIIYCDDNQQVWQWVKKEPSKPSASREHHFYYDQSGLPLIQKLDGLVFALEELDEDGGISIQSVAERVKSALDVDRITKRFYDRFKDELAVFKRFVTGLSDVTKLDWYTSLMLDRLMFIYFVQKKGFLDNNKDYLRDRLASAPRILGKDKFYSFYRSFLRVLFHEGLNSNEERSTELQALLGAVPYLNGGLFEEHEIERDNPNLDIPDKAFTGIFGFFDQYDWHLDTRPMRNQNEINPDVLGYIFEKYINAIQPGEQKAKGAYYTKEDITGYIAQNTVIPYLFDTARKDCGIAFKGEHSLWALLRDDPDRYIYPAVKLGVIDNSGNVIPESDLPDFVQIGMHDPKARMFDKRYNLTEAFLWSDEIGQTPPQPSPKRGGGQPVPPIRLTLPTETWREYVERRTRCLELREKLAAGEVTSIDDLITYNLDIRQFAQDVVENTESQDVLKAFWDALTNVTVLDPTCGSGAFLFAALGILEPLYEGCLGRMREFLEVWGDAGRKLHPNYCKWFTDTLEHVERHPSRPYFIFKSIILNNLYGVDIMPEAVEICKLRLFLKLAAQVEPDRSKPNMGLDPLPDIDFNIRAGNTLVGFATEGELRATVEGSQQSSGAFDFDDTMADINENARLAQNAWDFFHDAQVKPDTPQPDLEEAKADVRLRLAHLNEQLNRYLAARYGDKAKEYQKWLASHQPFHWFVEFYGIMKRGGFDVIIGNPPYVELAKVHSYSVLGYSTLDCGNLYALVAERTLALNRKGGWCGLIVPISVACTERMADLQDLQRKNCSSWYSSYDMRPASLFSGISQRLTISLLQKTDSETLHCGGFRRWSEVERPNLLALTSYCGVDPSGVRLGYLPKLATPREVSVWRKTMGEPLALHETPAHQSPVYVHRIVRYFVKAVDYVPHFSNETEGEKRSDDYKPFYLTPVLSRPLAALLNSSLFYWHWRAFSDGFHCGYRDVRALQLGHLSASPYLNELSGLASVLMTDLKNHCVRKTVLSKATGRVEYDEFNVKVSKPIIDQIDCVLAKHYGFTDEELDFIVNYDIKYRMGLGDGEDGEDN
ncbi:MAG: SAM-dependent methyltransferase [Armatimonadota bacterium]|nr:SAM-dependent methyltransferase [Armatimonadota bacterium]